jgi:hypothetical protein
MHTMTRLTSTSKPAGWRFRLLALLCVVLTLSIGIGTVVSASEGVHHELDIVQVGSVPTIICHGDDRSCGLPDQEKGHIVPHLHVAEFSFFALPSTEPARTFFPLVPVRFQLALYLPAEELTLPSAERPPRVTCN